MNQEYWEQFARTGRVEDYLSYREKEVCKAKTEKYGDKCIKNAFLAYVDEVLTGKKTPENLMYYFLSFDEALDCFGVVNHYLNEFTLYYTHGSNGS